MCVCDCVHAWVAQVKLKAQTFVSFTHAFIHVFPVCFVWIAPKQEGKKIEIWIREKVETGGQDTDEARVVDLLRRSQQDVFLGPVDEEGRQGGDEGQVPGTEGEGEWLRIKDGITIGSGAGAFVMPTSWLPGTR